MHSHFRIDARRMNLLARLPKNRARTHWRTCRRPETGTLDYRWTCVHFLDFGFCAFYSQMRRAVLFSFLSSAHSLCAALKVTNNNLNLVKIIQCRHRVNEMNELKWFSILKTNSLPAISVSRFVSSVVVVARYFSFIASAVSSGLDGSLWPFAAFRRRFCERIRFRFKNIRFDGFTFIASAVVLCGL